MSKSTQTRLLIAASGTGGHLFPALAVAEQLSEYKIQWLGVPHRLENTLVPDSYPLNIVAVEGLQGGFSLKTIKIAVDFVLAVFQVQKLIKQQQIDAVFTTGGYIAAPAILAARLQNKPAILHESNFIPGKVTRFLSRWCSKIALGFRGTAQYLPQVDTEYVSTPVRSQFLTPQNLDLAIPDDAMLIVVAGGSQGAVALNQLVRKAASTWLAKGAYIVLLMGLVTKNAILLVDFALAAIQQGKPQFKAVTEAGVSRLRPILMTSLSTIAGMIPIALGIGADGEVRSPMAIAVIGGFTTSTLLTLVVVPVLFPYIDGIYYRLVIWLRHRLRDDESN